MTIVPKVVPMICVLLIAVTVTLWVGYAATEALIQKVRVISSESMPKQLVIARFLENVNSASDHADELQRHGDSQYGISESKRGFQEHLSQIKSCVEKFDLPDSKLTDDVATDFDRLVEAAEARVSTLGRLDRSRGELSKAQGLALQATARVEIAMRRIHNSSIQNMKDAWTYNQACQAQVKNLLIHLECLGNVRMNVNSVLLLSNRYKLTTFSDKLKALLDTMRDLSTSKAVDSEKITALTDTIEKNLLKAGGLLELKALTLRDPQNEVAVAQLKAMEEKVSSDLEAVRTLDIETIDPLELLAPQYEQRMIAATQVVSLAGEVVNRASEASLAVASIEAETARLAKASSSEESNVIQSRIKERLRAGQKGVEEMRALLIKLGDNDAVSLLAAASAAIDRIAVALLSPETGAFAAVEQTIAANARLNTLSQALDLTLQKLNDFGRAQLRNAEASQVGQIREAEEIAGSSRIGLIVGAIVVLCTGMAMGLWVQRSISRTLTESDERFKQITNAISEVFWMSEVGTGRVLYVSPAYERVWKREARTLYENPMEFVDAIHPDDRARIIKSLQLNSGSSLNEEYRLVWPDGSIRWIWDRGFPIFDGAGKLIRTAGIAQDITDRKRLEAERDEANRKLVDVSREAGKAEIATSVLHNVGNVLNSVNVSATLVSELIQHSKAASLNKVAVLFHEHANDLGSYISTDEKGKLLPAYLGRLADALAEERVEAVKELETLTKNIEHIKDIVSMQQAYAQTAGIVESVTADSLIEDSLRLNAGSLAQHGIRVVRDLADNPHFSVDRHKVLQILINLIQNAKHAMKAGSQQDKCLTIKVRTSDQCVTFSVADNGLGIPQQNLTRIFSRGFTTKKDGHGFGLHSAALAAKEMKGALTAHSDGPGKGAEFVLELPLLPVETTV